MRSQKATKKQNGKFYILTLQRYVGAEAEALEEEGLDEKRLHLTAKLERQFAESAKLEAIIQENLRGWVLVDSSSIAEDYQDFLRELKERIVQYQVRVVLSVNRELVLLYWSIERNILNRQQQRGWGAKVIDNLAVD